MSKQSRMGEAGAPSLSVIDARAAGVDVGSERMHVSIGGGPPRVFETFTRGLNALRDWLVEEGVRTVAMEATGVYWLPLYGVLEGAGIQVAVVNGAHVKNLPGRKTDMADSQWIATLHAHGMLRGGFVPGAEVRRLRDYHRLREDHVAMAAAHVQHMQKALERMNLKVHDVLSQLAGVSGLRVVRAILEGVRDPEALAGLCDPQVLRHKRERLVESLRGTWAPEHLFALRQALAGWEFYQDRLRECDAEIATVLEAMAGPELPDGDKGPPRKGKKAAPNAHRIEGLDGLLARILGGKDPSALPTLTHYTVTQLLAEVGTDLTRWPTEKHFTAWLGLCPGSRQSGKSRRRESRGMGRAGRLFCTAARSMARSSQTALGGFYRRLRATRGGQVAVMATARKVAVLYHRLMTRGLDYVEHGLLQYEQLFREQHVRRITAAARKLGLTVSSNPQPTT
jgi:transposase